MAGDDTQAQERRSAETYGKLVTATVNAVFEHGYAGATMTVIAQTAGVTRGAIQHHFGDRRVDIIARVTEHILRERQEAYASFYGASPAEGETVDTRAAMKAAYRDPATWFLIEVWIASKSDPELRDRVNTTLREVNDRGDMDIATHLSRLSDADFRVLKYFFRSLTRGIALEYSRKPDTALFDAVVDMALDALEGLNGAVPKA
ncbi:TetR/AcrR family transcriptional regulator [Azospirillum sp. B4]|uniref:TetR/AcrR family transcriptional regulator n=1 Tax=Azospirillum sp. B4 TaxID=95605 RepID=UPI00034A3937|nr:TetR/AcrR family transcriptional regulator [Azospirillum sp. B4]